MSGALRAGARRFPWAPAVVLIAGLLLFYVPIVQSTGTVVTGEGEDTVGHLLWSLGDERPAGRFFPYFDLASNTRIWGNDVKYNPLHLTRLVSIALGSGLPAGRLSSSPFTRCCSRPSTTTRAGSSASPSALP